jgi:hypothetical protein
MNKMLWGKVVSSSDQLRKAAVLSSKINTWMFNEVTIIGETSMKKIFAVLFLVTFTSAVLAHGGGCRKDSPPGQCCHAGSKPYHCH